MFDQLSEMEKNKVEKVSFENDFTEYLKTRNIKSEKVNKGHTVSKKHSKDIILLDNVKQAIIKAEKLYKENKFDFISENFEEYYSPIEFCNQDIKVCLIEGYSYFYKSFTNSKEIDVNYRCPICERETSLEWDHIIPKSLYPVFSLIPVNLIKICKTCNVYKKAKFNFTDELPFHPLYCNFETENNIQIDIDFKIMSKGLGEGLKIEYLDAKVEKLINLYNLEKLIKNRIKSEIAEFIKVLIDTNDFLTIQASYNPENNFGHFSSIKYITDAFIARLDRRELDLLVSPPIKAYFGVV